MRGFLRASMGEPGTQASNARERIDDFTRSLRRGCWRQIATGADPGQNGPLLRANSPASWQPCSVERVGVRSMPRRSVEG